MKKTTAYTGPLRFAHRGLAQVAPENTLGAFQGAVNAGFEGIEIDIQLSKDGEIIVAHDCNFTRMTLGHPTGFSNRRLQDMTWEEIQKMEIPYANHTLSHNLPRHSGVEGMAIMPDRLMGQESNSDYEAALAKDGRMAHLMRFSDFDTWLTTRPEPVIVEVEIKAPGVMQRMLEILDTSQNVGQYILFSGIPAYIAEIQASCCKQGKPAGLRLGANIRFLTEETKGYIQGMDLFEVGLNADSFTADNIRWLADCGIQVLSNLGDEPQWWAQMCQLGVLGFKTNYAAAFTDWWQANQ